MAIKFNEMSFDLKDVILIVGVVLNSVRYDQKQTDQYNQLKVEIAQMISDNKINDLKINNRFDAFIKTKETSHNVGIYKPELIAICNDYKLKLKRKYKTI